MQRQVIQCTRESIESVSRQALLTMAPTELTTFEQTADAYFACRKRKFRRKQDDLLGFGGETITAMAPYALAISEAVLVFVLVETAATVKEETSSAIHNQVKRFIHKGFHRRSEERKAPHNEVKDLQEIAKTKAIELGLSHDQASLLADAIVGAMSVKKSA